MTALTPHADLFQILTIAVINLQVYVLGFAIPNPWFRGGSYIESPQQLGSILNPKRKGLLQNQF